MISAGLSHVSSGGLGTGAAKLGQFCSMCLAICSWDPTATSAMFFIWQWQKLKKANVNAQGPSRPRHTLLSPLFFSLKQVAWVREINSTCIGRTPKSHESRIKNRVQSCNQSTTGKNRFPLYLDLQRAGYLCLVWFIKKKIVFFLTNGPLQTDIGSFLNISQRGTTVLDQLTKEKK